MVKWFKEMFEKEELPVKKQISEFTEFELSESHRILLTTENMIAELLELIRNQQELIQTYEEELSMLRSKNRNEG